MAKKKVVSKVTSTDASNSLLDINTKLHEVMANLEVEKKDQETLSVIPANLPQDTVVYAKQALEIINVALPDAPQLKGTDGIKSLTAIVEKVIAKYPEENGKMTVPVEVGAGLIHPIINVLANKIHDVAMTLIGATGQIQACKASEIDPDEAATIAKYCSGVLPNISVATAHKVPMKMITIKGKERVQYYPNLIEHDLGLHKTKVSTLSGDQDAKLAVEYRESGPTYHDSKNRMKGVEKRLVKEGFECHPAYPNLYCWGEIPKGKMTQLASFFSLLRDADVSNMGEGTIDTVSEKGWELATKLKNQYGDDVWKSGQNKPNWHQLMSEWLQEKEQYEKQAIYTDLKQLAIYRDTHHELEAAFDVDTGKKASASGKAKITENAQKAIELIKKNKWGGGLTSGLENQIYAFKQTGSGNTSDAIGNIIHQILFNQLSAVGQYGGCPIPSALPDVNAGALSYCEGTLKTTTTELKGGGSQPLHKVAPKTYQTIIIDENPGGGYDLHIPMEEGVWNNQLRYYLEDKFGFDCSSQSYGSWKAGQVCNVHIGSHDKIRLLAIFLSNLKGGSELIGDQCVPYAMSDAWNSAQSIQKDKGSMAFIAEPAMQTSKDWIDKCFKQYGIMPPGITEEQKAILSLMGPDKLYGGCDLSAEEIISNMGILNYCEGVRMNPLSKINAYLQSNGSLAHFFHGTTDQFAGIYITPLEAGKYQVDIKGLNMKSPALTKEVIKRLGEQNYTCSGNACSKEVGPEDLRKLAMFLSSLHQAYYLEDEQVPAAVDYALQEIDKIPNSKNAYKSAVSTFVTADWQKVVTGVPIEKKPAPAKAVPEAVKAGKPISASYIDSLLKKEKAPFNVGGCVSTVSKKPTLLEAGFCAGVMIHAIDEHGNEIGIPMPGKITSTGSFFKLGGDGQITFDSKWHSFYITLPDELIKIPAIGVALVSAFGMIKKDKKTYKSDYTYANTAARLGLFFSSLHNITQLPESCHGDAVLHAIEQSKKAEIKPIYPYSKDQWMKEVCTPEEKPEATLKKNTPISLLNTEEIAILKEQICSWKKIGLPLEEVYSHFGDIFALVEFSQMTKTWIAAAYQECGKPAEKLPKPSIDGLANALWEYLFLKNPTTWFSHTECTEWAQKTYDVDYAEVHSALGKLVTDGKLVADTTYGYKVKEGWGVAELPKYNLDLLIQLAGAKSNQLNKDIFADKALLAKCKGVTAYKKLPVKCKDAVHAYMNWKLLKDHKEGKSYADTLADAEGVLIKTFPNLTPLMVKLQLDIEKKSKKRKGELPAEPGEKVEKFYETLPLEEQSEIQDAIDSLVELGADIKATIDKVKDNYGLIETKALIDQVTHKWEEKEGVMLFSEGSPAVQHAVQVAITQKVSEDKSEHDVIEEIMDEFNLALSYDWKQYVQKEISAWEKMKAQKVKVSFDDLSPEMKENVLLGMYELAQVGKTADEIKAQISEEYYLVPDYAVSNAVTQAKASANWLKQGKIDASIYAKPWEQPGDWENIPFELSVCMGKKLNEIYPKATNTGMYVPFMNLKPPSGVEITEADMEKLWQECVQDYAAGFIGKEEKTINDVDENTKLSIINTIHGCVADELNLQDTAQNVSEQYEIKDDSDLREFIQSEIEKYEEFITTFTKEVAEKEPIKAWLVGFLKSNYQPDILFSLADIDSNISEHTDFGEVPLEDYLNELVAEGAIKKVGDSYQYLEVTPPKKLALKTVKEKVLEHLKTSGKFESVNDILVATDLNKKTVEQAIGDLVQDGSLLWDLVGKKYQYNKGAKVITPPLKKWIDVPLDEQKKIEKYVHDQRQAGKLDDEILQDLEVVAGIDTSTLPALSTLAEWYLYGKGKIEATENWEELITNYLKAQKGHKASLAAILTYFGMAEDVVIADTPFGKAFTKLLSEHKIIPLGKQIYGLPEEKPEYWTVTDESPAAITGFKAIIQKMWKEGKSEWEIRAYLHDTYHLLLDKALDTLVNNSLKEIGVLTAEKGKLKTYDELSEEGKLQLTDSIEDILKDEFAKDVHIFEEAWDKVESELPIVKTKPGLKSAAKKDWDSWLEKAKEKPEKIGKHYSELLPETQDEIKKEILEAVQAGQSIEGVKKHIKMNFPNLPWDKELESITDEIIKSQYEEEANIDYSDLSSEMEDEVDQEIKSMASTGMSEENIANVISGKYHVKWDDPTLHNVIKMLVTQSKEKPALKPEELEKYDEMIKAYYQMGWTPAAVIEYLSPKVPAEQLKKSATKLYKIYKPEVVRGKMEYDAVSLPLKNHLKALADKMLGEGKSVADTAWYISTNYAIEEEGVKAMVREVASKPLAQVKAAVKAFQFLGVGQYIGGCEITEQMTDLNPQNIAYCQGVLDKGGKLEESGMKVTHDTPTQEITVEPILKDSKWEVDFFYTDKDKSAERLAGVNQILGDLLDGCAHYPYGNTVSCKLSGQDGMELSIADQDKIRKVALFLSEIDNVGKLDAKCIPYALKYAFEQAKKKNETSKPWSINQFPNSVEDWTSIVCSKILA